MNRCAGAMAVAIAVTVGGCVMGAPATHTAGGAWRAADGDRVAGQPLTVSGKLAWWNGVGSAWSTGNTFSANSRKLASASKTTPRPRPIPVGYSATGQADHRCQIRSDVSWSAVAPPTGFEPAASSLEVTCSVQLSYGGVSSLSLMLGPARPFSPWQQRT